MEKYELSLESARKNIQVADHMMSVTFKVVKDPKLLLSIVDRIKNSLFYAVSSVVQYERMYKRVPPYQDNFESVFNIFKTRITRRYNVNIEYITLITDINSILNQHQKSPMEFRRNDKFVICSADYRTKVITEDNIKKYIEKAKVFIRETENMVKGNARTA